MCHIRIICDINPCLRIANKRVRLVKLFQSLHQVEWSGRIKLLTNKSATTALANDDGSATAQKTDGAQTHQAHIMTDRAVILYVWSRAVE